MRESVKQHNEADALAAPVSTVHGLLFRAKNSTEARPFDSIPDLGRTIARLPEGSYAGKESVVTSFLRQVFNGVRPCPNDYLRAIIAATRLRVEERSITADVDTLIVSIEKGIPALKKRRERRLREKHRSRSAKPFGPADVRFIVNPPLSVYSFASSGCKRLSLMIAESLVADANDGTVATVYKICVPAETDAVDLWRLIFDELTGKTADPGGSEVLDASGAVSRIQTADSKGHLQVYLIPYYLCLASAMIENPDSRDDCSGVTLHLDKGGQTKLSEIRERNIGYWRQMYYELENGVLGVYRRLEFANYLNLIVR